MSGNFWARKLGAQNPPPARPAPPADTSRPWWSSAPSQPAQLTGTPFGAQPAVQNVPEGHHVITPDEIDMRKLPSTNQREECPGCGSGNYFAPLGTRKQRCFDCGYPVIHTTSGMGGKGGTPGTPARQVSSMTMTDPSGRVMGKVPAASGYRGQSTYNPQNPDAGRVT